MTGSPSARIDAPGATLRDSALVVCDRVALTYGTGRTSIVAVHELSCRIEPAARIAIVGRSGSGKSSVLHLLAGLVAPTAGQIHRPVSENPRVRRVGVIFQGPSLLPALTVLENVTFPLLLAREPWHDARPRAVRALHQLGVGDLTGALPQQLSGGQAQRVAAARMLATQPTLILADEPTAHLDQTGAAALVDALESSADDLGAALVVATHDLSVADRFPTRWAMQDGRLTTSTIPGRTHGTDG